MNRHQKRMPRSRQKHPMQPVVWDGRRVIRFKANKIVNYLLEWASSRGCNLNDLARMDFAKDDRTQFAQLIGYSVSGAGDLPYFDRALLARADAEASKLASQRARRTKRTRKEIEKELHDDYD